MLKKSTYLSPECETIDVSTEGVLCASVDRDFVNDGNETFDKLNDFEW